MDDFVLNIEQMQELVDKGIDTSKASMYWYVLRNGEPWGVLPKDCPMHPKLKKVPTFIFQDILYLIPHDVNGATPMVIRNGDLWECSFLVETYTETYIVHEQFGSTPLEAAFNMLKECKQNNLI